MLSFGQQKCLRWTVYNLALSSFHKFSGLFAILFCLQWSRHLSWEILQSELGLTLKLITRTIDFAHFSLTMLKNIEANWKIKDFPDPFGRITNMSRPPTTISSASCCKSIWNVSKTLCVPKLSLYIVRHFVPMIWRNNLCTDLCLTKICGWLSDWLRLTKESSRVQPCLWTVAGDQA